MHRTSRAAVRLPVHRSSAGVGVRAARPTSPAHAGPDAPKRPVPPNRLSPRRSCRNAPTIHHPGNSTPSIRVRSGRTTNRLLGDLHRGCPHVSVPPTEPYGEHPVKVGLDATPLLGQRSGVGRTSKGCSRASAVCPTGPTCCSRSSASADRCHHPCPPAPGWLRAGPPRTARPGLAGGALPPGRGADGPGRRLPRHELRAPPLARASGVVTVHDLAYLRYPETVDDEVRAYRELVPPAVGRAGRVITVSQGDRRRDWSPSTASTGTRSSSHRRAVTHLGCSLPRRRRNAGAPVGARPLPALRRQPRTPEEPRCCSSPRTARLDGRTRQPLPWSWSDRPAGGTPGADGSSPTPPT